jgi:glyoxylase-like metal-dependent hydrolase (beta-lactamase superfamily II)
VGIKIHNIVTGELENTLAGHLLNAANHPDHSAEEVLPFGFTHDHVLHDGTPAAGGMVPIPVWLIEGASKKILIDTGLGDLDELMSMMKTYGVDMFASRDEDQDIVAGLAARGVTPEEIDIVVLTHLHFDHIGNNHLFPNAKFIVQRSEVAQGFTPPKYCQFSYPEYSYNVTNVRDRIQIIEGDMQRVPGVRLIKIGGHTPGTMVVVVDTDEGRVALAGDIMYNYKNLELNWPTGSFWDLQDLMSGYDRLHLEADIIIPGHDWEFRERYPSGTIG